MNFLNASLWSQIALFSQNIQHGHSGLHRNCAARKCTRNQTWFWIVFIRVQCRPNLSSFGNCNNVNILTNIQCFKSKQFASSGECLNFVSPNSNFVLFAKFQKRNKKFTRCWLIAAFAQHRFKNKTANIIRMFGHMFFQCCQGFFRALRIFFIIKRNSKNFIVIW